MGTRPFRLYPPFTCRLQHQREKTLLFLPPLHAVKRKKNEETLFLASPRLICIPVFLEKEAHDWRIKRGGGGVVSGNLRARHQPHKTAAITADTLSLFSLEEGKGMDSWDRCRSQVSEVTWLLLNSSSNEPLWVLRAPGLGPAGLVAGWVSRMRPSWGPHYPHLHIFSFDLFLIVTWINLLVFVNCNPKFFVFAGWYSVGIICDAASRGKKRHLILIKRAGLAGCISTRLRINLALRSINLPQVAGLEGSLMMSHPPQKQTGLGRD